MEKRYQIFISSTFADLQDERRRVIQTVMELDCFPAGMELFPAADEEQWEFIKRVIDDCDYYLLIVGGRYGSITGDGISYTEKEYDYAVARGMRVLVFVHEKPDEIPVGKSELDPDARVRLEAFRKKITEGRLVKFWSRADELPGLVALSLQKTIKAYPAVGWSRATGKPNVETLAEINDLRKENSALQAELEKSRTELAAQPVIPDIVSIDEQTKITGTHTVGEKRRVWTTRISWYQLFAVIAPSLLDHPNDANAKKRIASYVYQFSPGIAGRDIVVNSYDFDTIKTQLMAYKLVKITYSKTTNGSMGLFWSLTPAGHRLMLEARTVRRSTEKNVVKAPERNDDVTTDQAD